MTYTVVTPKFLTQDIAEIAIQQVLKMVIEPAPLGLLLKSQDCHIVVLVPAMKDGSVNSPSDWPDYPLIPHVLYEHSIGNKLNWNYKYDKIARSKALQLWQERNDDRSDVIPHLLFTGDTPYWGGIKRQGIVVTCSGFECWFDKMIAGMIADMMIGLAYHDWMRSEDKKKEVERLT